MPFGFMPSESVFAKHDCEFWGIFGGFNDGFESASGIGIIGFIIHDTRLNVILSALDIDEIVLGGAVVFYQPKFGLFPVVSISAFCETDSMVPMVILSLPKIPHPEFVTNAMDRPVIDGAGTVGCPGRTGMNHNLGPINTSSIRHELQANAVLERNAVVVEREQDDLIGAYVF